MFTFTEITDKTLAAKFASKQIYDPQTMCDTANKILSSLPESMLADVTDEASASAAVLKYADSYFMGNNAPAAPASADMTATDGNTTVVAAPTASDNRKASVAAKQLFKSGIARSAGASITAAITTKPAAKDRFKAGDQIKVSCSADFIAKFKEYKEKGAIVPDSEVAGNAAKYEEMTKLIESNGLTPIYINEKSKPTVGGYRISDKAAEKGTVIVKKDKVGFAGLLVRDYATKIREVDGASVLGAYVKKSSSKNNTIGGINDITVKVTGLNKYFEENPEGEAIFTINENGEKKEVTAKSDISVVVYAINNGVVDTKKKKTIRLSGKIAVAPVEQKPDVDQAITFAGISVSAARGSETVPEFSENDKEILAGAMAAIGFDASASTGVAGDLYNIMSKVTVGGNSGNLD